MPKPFELTGSPAALENAWPLVRTGGTMVLVGSVFPSRPMPLLLEQVVRRVLTIRGVHNYASRHLQQAIEFLGTATRYPFAALISNGCRLRRHSVPLKPRSRVHHFASASQLANFQIARRYSHLERTSCVRHVTIESSEKCP